MSDWLTDPRSWTLAASERILAEELWGDQVDLDDLVGVPRVESNVAWAVSALLAARDSTVDWNRFDLHVAIPLGEGAAPWADPDVVAIRESADRATQDPPRLYLMNPLVEARYFDSPYYEVILQALPPVVVRHPGQWLARTSSVRFDRGDDYSWWLEIRAA